MLITLAYALCFECSHSFADLVGFTKWSSTRSPEEVFLLLETIYGAFDQIADRRKVFKIETMYVSTICKNSFLARLCVWSNPTPLTKQPKMPFVL